MKKSKILRYLEKERRVVKKLREKITVIDARKARYERLLAESQKDLGYLDNFYKSKGDIENPELISHVFALIYTIVLGLVPIIMITNILFKKFDMVVFLVSTVISIISLVGVIINIRNLRGVK